jgi:hypothetical protein
MKLPQPRDADDHAHRLTTLILWSAGIVVLFAPAAFTILLFATDPLSGPIGSNSPRADLTFLLSIATTIAGVAMYLLALRQAHRYGRGRGIRYRHAEHNPVLFVAFWMAQYGASWIALGLLFGRIDRRANISALHIDQGTGLFLLAFGMLMVVWALGRFGSKH